MPQRSHRVQRQDVPAPLDLSDEDTARLRRAQLDLLKELDRVCRRNGLDYFALYGTLLGAVRHQGFIPWDDDLDVGMLRDDFDRLVEVASRDLADGFTLQTVDSDPAYGCMFAKLRLDGTRCVDRISHGSPQHGGIFVDVFPLDAKPPKGLRAREQKAMRYVGFRLLYLKAGYHFIQGTSIPWRVIRTAARSLIRLIPRSLIISLTERHTRLGNQNPREYVSLFGAYLYDRDTMDAEWIHPLVEIPFEDTTIPAPADSDAYLRQIYGDYMTPPPPELQIGYHEIVELDFGPHRESTSR